MIICSDGYTCCNWRYTDKLQDVEEECQDCSRLLEVETIKKGKWEHRPLKKYPEEYIDVCSICGNTALAEYNYCPNCGAKMVK